MISTQEGYLPLVSSHIMMLSKLQVIFPRNLGKGSGIKTFLVIILELILEAGRAVLFPQTRNTGIYYYRMLLHDTMLGDDSRHTGTADTPVCECGLERETTEHFVCLFEISRSSNKVDRQFEGNFIIIQMQKMLQPSETFTVGTIQ